MRSGEPASPGGVFFSPLSVDFSVDPSLFFNSAGQLRKILARVMQSSDALVLHVNHNNLTFSFCSQRVTKCAPWVPASRKSQQFIPSMTRKNLRAGNHEQKNKLNVSILRDKGTKLNQPFEST